MGIPLVWKIVSVALAKKATVYILGRVSAHIFIAISVRGYDGMRKGGVFWGHCLQGCYRGGRGNCWVRDTR